MKSIILRQTHAVLEDYTLSDCRSLENMLTVTDKFKKPTDYIYEYDRVERKLIIPRGMDMNLVQDITGRELVIDSNHDVPKKSIIQLNTNPRDDLQRQALSFLLGEGKYTFTKNNSQVSLNLEPGQGKTFLGISSICYERETAIIITHLERLKVQWTNSLLKFTNIDESEICNIVNSTAISRLNNINPKFKVYIVNHATIHSYASKHGWDSIDSFFKHLGIGVKIYDEAHLLFHNIMNIDYNTNTRKNIYLQPLLIGLTGKRIWYLGIRLNQFLNLEEL